MIPMKLEMIMAAIESSTVARNRTEISSTTGTLGADRNTHIALQQIPDIDEILVGIGVVEPELFTDPGYFRRRGEFPQEKMGGVSGDEPQHEKDQDGDPDKNKDEMKQTS